MIDKTNFYTLGKGLFALNFLYHAKGLFTRTAFSASAGAEER